MMAVRPKKFCCTLIRVTNAISELLYLSSVKFISQGGHFIRTILLWQVIKRIVFQRSFSDLKMHVRRIVSLPDTRDLLPLMDRIVQPDKELAVTRVDGEEFIRVTYNDRIAVTHKITRENHLSATGRPDDVPFSGLNVDSLVEVRAFTFVEIAYQFSAHRPDESTLVGFFADGNFLARVNAGDKDQLILFHAGDIRDTIGINDFLHRYVIGLGDAPERFALFNLMIHPWPAFI